MNIDIDFSQLIESLSGCKTYKHCLSHCRDILNKIFTKYNEKQIVETLDNLLKLSLDSLKIPKVSIRIASLSIVGLFMDLVNDQESLRTIAQGVERLFPSFDIEINEGATSIYERIIRRSKVTILPKLLDRLWVLPISNTIMTLVFLLKKLYFPYIHLANRYRVIIERTIYAGIRSDICIVSTLSIDLCIFHLEHDSSTENFTNSIIDYCTSILISSGSSHEVHCSIGLLVRIFSGKHSISNERLSVFIEELINYFIRNPNEIHSISLDDVIRYFKNEMKRYIEHLYQKTEFNQNFFLVLLQEYPDLFKKEAIYMLNNSFNDKYLTIFSSLICLKQISGDEIVFDISRTPSLCLTNIGFFGNIVSFYQGRNCVLNQYLIYEIDKMVLEMRINDFSKSIICFSCRYFPYFFEQIEFIIANHSKIDDATYEMVIDSTFSMIDDSEDRLQLILFNSIAFNILKLNNEIYIVHFLDCIHKKHRNLVLDSNVLPIMKSFMLNLSISVQISFIKSMGNADLTFLAFEEGDTQNLINSYSSTNNLKEKKRVIESINAYIEYGYSISPKDSNIIISFLLSVLDSRMNSSNAILYCFSRRIEHNDDRMIRRRAIKCFQSILGKNLFHLKSHIPHLVNSLADQLSISTHESLHIDVIKTLYMIFSITEIAIDELVNIVDIHSKLIVFINQNRNGDIHFEIIKLLGLIGPLDPFQFPSNLMHSYRSHRYFFHDPEKRNQSYLMFVMDFLLEELHSASSNFHPSVLVNAIMYIFDSDPQSCLKYASTIIDTFHAFLIQLVFNPPDQIFIFLRSIIKLVDIDIIPYQHKIMDMITPYIVPFPNYYALKALSTMVHTLKSRLNNISGLYSIVFSFGFDSNLSHDIQQSILYLLGSIAVYIHVNEIELFSLYRKAILSKNNLSNHAINYLQMIMRQGTYPNLIVPIFELCLLLTDSSYKKSVLNLWYSLIDKYSDQINELSGLFDKFRQQNSSDLDHNSVFVSVFEIFTPESDFVSSIKKPKMTRTSLQSLLNENYLESSRNSGDWESWFLQFTQICCLNSLHPAIRSCRPLLTIGTTFEKLLFPVALFSLWEDLSPSDKDFLSTYIESTTNSKYIPSDILFSIINACDIFDKSGIEIVNPHHLALICEKCFLLVDALRYYEKDKQFIQDSFKKLLHINSSIQKKEDVKGLIKFAENNLFCESFLRSISHNNNFQKDFSYSSLQNNIKHLVRLRDWDSICAYSNQFFELPDLIKTKAAPYFIIASQMKSYDYSKYITYLSFNSVMSCYWMAWISIMRSDHEFCDIWIKKGQRLICNLFFNQVYTSYEQMIPLVYHSTLFEELNDVLQTKMNGYAANVFQIWKKKAIIFQNDTKRFCNIFNTRVIFDCPKEELLQIKLTFFNTLRRLHEWQIIDASLADLLPNDDDPRVELLKTKISIEKGSPDGIEKLEKIVISLQNTQYNEAFIESVCSYANRVTPSEKSILYLDTALKIYPLNVGAWKSWSYSNLFLSHRDGFVKEPYVDNALKGFWTLLDISSPKMHYINQICSIFFQHGTLLSSFDESSKKMLSLSIDCLEMVIPQIILNIEHKENSVRNIVFELLNKLSDKCFHLIVYHLSLLLKTRELSSRSLHHIQKILDQNSLQWNCVTMFVNFMIDSAILPAERVIRLIEKVLLYGEDYPFSTGFYTDLDSIIRIVNENYILFHREWFSSKACRLFLNKAQKLLDKSHPPSNSERVFFFNSITAFRKYLISSLDSISLFDISEVNPEFLSGKYKYTPLPGCISFSPAYPTINSVHPLLRIMPGAKKPRKVQFITSTGQKAKYLLKGNDDIRLDQYIMRFFSLFNSILKADRFDKEKHLSITQYRVIPLSDNVGLISWAEHSETMFSVIKWYRKMRMQTENREDSIITKHIDGGKDKVSFLNHIQKLELFRDLCSSTPPDDIREALWIRSHGSQDWIDQRTSFTRSVALMSMVGYIIGLGDRHTLNILIQKGRGNIIHIDLSDCFEKASLRKYVHETVPFRLTRMIISALGAPGPYGEFSHICSYTLSVFRWNKLIILSYLEIFLKEQIIEKIWSQSGITKDPKQVVQRIEDKLNGNDLEKNDMSIIDHVNILIEAATSEYNLSKMYIGWAAYW